MRLSHLSLTNFRNFRQLDLDVPSGVTVISGRNAQGKTSLLEAIYLLAIARSFRAESEHQVVGWTASSEDGTALVSGTFDHEGVETKINIAYRLSSSARPDSLSEIEGARPSPTLRKQISVSRVRRSASELVGVVNAVLFSADDIQLVYGAPSLRRRYLDILISQVSQPYLKTLQRYQKVLLQRNRLLKMIHERKAGEDELAFWDEQLIAEGTWITERRHETMSSLADYCREEHIHLSGGSEPLVLDYQPSVPAGPINGEDSGLKLAFEKALDASRTREKQRGSTEVGPHRDNLKLWVGGVDMGTYASRGQARTLALALRLGEAAFLSTARGHGPIVLLDDVLSELDALRRERVLSRAAEYPQTLITTSDMESLQAFPLSGATYMRVEDGEVSPQ
ncbi:MAG: DNA replication/repair protein RecF [Dehalococcoidia bacterium]|nr:DNA replication/repair protein RecF [Dehalococcoidia bacterium]